MNISRNEVFVIYVDHFEERDVTPFRLQVLFEIRTHLKLLRFHVQSDQSILRCMTDDLIGQFQAVWMIQFHTMVHSCFAFETENNIYNPLKQSDAEAEENIDHNINLHLIGNILQFS